MHIGWIVPGFQGGADEPGIPALNDLARTIGSTQDLHVFAVRFPPRSKRYRVAGGIHVQSFGRAETRAAHAQARRVASIRRWAHVLKALSSMHRRTPFTVLHGFWATEAGMLAAVAGHLLRVPVLVGCCGGELAAVGPVEYGSRLRRLERLQVALTLHLATRIGVGSNDLRRRLLLRYPWLAARTDYLPLGFDPAVFGPPPAHRETIQGRIICVASWSPVKGHDLLLDALCSLSRRCPATHLMLVGERTDGLGARAAVTQRGLSDRVFLMGALPQAEVAALLHASQVAAITSWHEAQCLAVVEALACGVPVVSTATGIARELLRDPIIGSSLSSRSPSALANALAMQLRMASDTGVAAREVRRKAVADLSLECVAERFLTAYRELAGDEQARPARSVRS